MGDDPRNTDHAWVEAVTVAYHDDTGVLNNYPLGPGSALNGATWHMACRTAALSPTALTILQQVHYLFNLYPSSSSCSLFFCASCASSLSSLSPLSSLLFPTLLAANVDRAGGGDTRSILDGQDDGGRHYRPD